MSYQCLICYGPTPLKGGGLCFTCAMERAGAATSELWCSICRAKGGVTVPLAPPVPR